MNTSMLVFELLNEMSEQPFYGSFKYLSRPQPWHEIASIDVFMLARQCLAKGDLRDARVGRGELKHPDLGSKKCASPKLTPVSREFPRVSSKFAKSRDATL